MATTQRRRYERLDLYRERLEVERLDAEYEANIEVAAEFTLTDEGAYYYGRDIASTFGLSQDEVELVFERAADLRRERRMGW
jgi:uncharacterized lipoprotein YmbA